MDVNITDISFIYRTVQPEKRKPHCLRNYNFLESTLRGTDSDKIDVRVFWSKTKVGRR